MRRTLLACLPLAAALVATPAQAAPLDAGRPTVGLGACAPHSSARAGGVPTGSTAVTRHHDESAYTQRQVLRIDRRLERRLERRLGTSTTPAIVRAGVALRIGVHVHVIGSKNDRGPSVAKVEKQLEVLNDAFAGGQSEFNTATSFTFYLASYERVKNARWYRASIDSEADYEMRRELHVGGAADLNLYLLKPRDTDGKGFVLGWSSAPWHTRDGARFDGVTIHQGSLPGGDLEDYGMGDTTVHEVGHWLGLLHTFEGYDCEGPGDLVEDTPAQSEPSTTCEGDKDTCPTEGLDPVHNFMDYAVDACMDEFTPGQVSRMTDNWLAYRTP